jgi:hypothetical protein
VSEDTVESYVVGCAYTWILVLVIVVVIGMSYEIINSFNEPPAIEVFSARFDECMATEQYTREECIAYADEGE